MYLKFSVMKLNEKKWYGLQIWNKQKCPFHNTSEVKKIHLVVL